MVSTSDLHLSALSVPELLGMCLQVCAGVCRCVQVRAGVCRCVQCAGVCRSVQVMCRSVQECAGVCRSVQECAGVCRSVQECAGVCRSVQECAGVCRSVQECAGVCRNGKKNPKETADGVLKEVYNEIDHLDSPINEIKVGQAHWIGKAYKDPQGNWQQPVLLKFVSWKSRNTRYKSQTHSILYEG